MPSRLDWRAFLVLTVQAAGGFALPAVGQRHLGHRQAAGKLHEPLSPKLRGYVHMPYVNRFKDLWLDP